jgi:hypothetical protein
VRRFAIALCAALLALALFSPANAAPAYHAGTLHDCGFGTSDGSAHYTCAFSANLSAGDLLIACSRVEGGRLITAMSDGTNGAYTLLDTASHNAAAKHLTCYYFQNNSSTGTPTVTVTENGGGGATITLVVQAYTGVKTSSALISASHTDGTGSNAATKTCASLSATAANQLLFGDISMNGSTAIAPNSGETERFENPFEAQNEDKLTSGSGSVSVSWAFTPNDDGGCVTALFDTAAASTIAKPLTGPLGGPLQGPAL